MPPIHIIGGGLAGSEAAWQVAAAGVPVMLHEMRPVRPTEAHKTDGKQSNNNLLLSSHARVDTKPQLEIFADDVKCTHGATVGRLDETAML